MARRLALLALAVCLAACGGGSDTPTGPSRRTETFSGSLDDPTRCTCENGINQYTLQVATRGTVEAAGTPTPADAQLVVRLLDESFNTVHATSTLSGGVARFSFEAAPATYRVQVFLGSDGPRQANFTLSLTHP